MSPGSHRYMTSELSKNTNSRVFALDYRLAPENCYPCSLVDALAAFLALTETQLTDISCSINNITYKHSSIIIAGDSSGGCLALQLLLAIKMLRLPQPNAAILISPFLNNECNSNSWLLNSYRDFMTLDYVGIKWALDVYSNGMDLSNEFISPINNDLKDLCPILVQAGDCEILFDDSIKLSSVGKVEIYRGGFHVFQMFGLEIGRVAFSRIGDFVDEILNGQEDDKSSDTISGVGYTLVEVVEGVVHESFVSV